jgi:hypothetical protein
MLLPIVYISSTDLISAEINSLQHPAPLVLLLLPKLVLLWLLPRAGAICG